MIHLRSEASNAYGLQNPHGFPGDLHWIGLLRSKMESCLRLGGTVFVWIWQGHLPGRLQVKDESSVTHQRGTEETEKLRNRTTNTQWLTFGLLLQVTVKQEQLESLESPCRVRAHPGPTQTLPSKPGHFGKQDAMMQLLLTQQSHDTLWPHRYSPIL